jgi:hypothetical protein
MSLVELELNEWNVNHKRDRLVGCSLSGWQDMVNKTSMNFEEQCLLLKELKEVAKNTIKNYSKELNDKESVCVTTIKPDGCTLGNHIKIFDDGIYDIFEIYPEIDNTIGFTEINKFYINKNKVSKVYKNNKWFEFIIDDEDYEKIKFYFPLIEAELKKIRV